MAIKPNLNVNNKENQNQKEIKPLNEEQNDINENRINTNSFNFIFDILKNINYQTERISKIKGDITQKDIKNISLFEVKNKKNKKRKIIEAGKQKKNGRGRAKKIKTNKKSKKIK